MFFLFCLSQAFSFFSQDIWDKLKETRIWWDLHVLITLSLHTHPKNETYRVLSVDKIQLVHFNSFKMFIFS